MTKVVIENMRELTPEDFERHLEKTTKNVSPPGRAC